jgi:hypothetical protein
MTTVVPLIAGLCRYRAPPSYHQGSISPPIRAALALSSVIVYSRMRAILLGKVLDDFHIYLWWESGLGVYLGMHFRFGMTYTVNSDDLRTISRNISCWYILREINDARKCNPAANKLSVQPCTEHVCCRCRTPAHASCAALSCLRLLVVLPLLRIMQLRATIFSSFTQTP